MGKIAMAEAIQTQAIQTQIVQRLQGLPEHSLHQVLALVENLYQQEHGQTSQAEPQKQHQSTRKRPRDLSIQERLKLLHDWIETYGDDTVGPLPDEALSRDSIYCD
jgi:hypothetical protein